MDGVALGLALGVIGIEGPPLVPQTAANAAKNCGG